MFLKIYIQAKCNSQKKKRKFKDRIQIIDNGNL